MGGRGGGGRGGGYEADGMLAIVGVTKNAVPIHGRSLTSTLKGERFLLLDVLNSLIICGRGRRAKGWGTAIRMRCILRERDAESVSVVGFNIYFCYVGSLISLQYRTINCCLSRFRCFKDLLELVSKHGV